VGLKVKDIVEHRQYPGVRGEVVGIKKRDSHAVATILVYWNQSRQLSKHVPSALRVV
jgi:hypothetical protein